MYSSECSDNNTDPWFLVSAEIILRAVTDWKRICNGTMTETNLKNIKELRVFFSSGWCDMLLLGTSIRQDDLIKEMERYYERHYVRRY